jgi:lysophospholipid acyltransferase (LPLAT)-like uncharacterized protein
MMFRAKLLSFIGWLVLSVWGRTIRMEFVNKEAPDRLAAEGKNCIYAFWHGRQFLLLLSHRNSDIVINASESRDGDIQAIILKRFGYDVVRGSSKRKGARALLGLVEGLRKGKNAALAVDGPRGPLYEAKQGVTYLAGKLDKPIIPVSSSAKRHWILDKIWDQYLLPAPFTRGVAVYGEPIVVKGISDAELDSKRQELERILNGLMARADEYFAPRT